MDTLESPGRDALEMEADAFLTADDYGGRAAEYARAVSVVRLNRLRGSSLEGNSCDMGYRYRKLFVKGEGTFNTANERRQRGILS